MKLALKQETKDKLIGFCLLFMLAAMNFPFAVFVFIITRKGRRS